MKEVLLPCGHIRPEGMTHICSAGIDVVENPTKEEHGFHVTQMSIFNMQVCSKLGADEVEKAVNLFTPSGTQNGWRLEREGAFAPVECAEGGGNKHYIFSC